MPRHFLQCVLTFSEVACVRCLAPACGLVGYAPQAKDTPLAKPVGDPWIMPGLFLVDGPNIVWHHDFKHAGDHPDFSKISQLSVA